MWVNGILSISLLLLISSGASTAQFERHPPRVISWWTSIPGRCRDEYKREYRTYSSKEVLDAITCLQKGAQAMAAMKKGTGRGVYINFGQMLCQVLVDSDAVVEEDWLVEVQPGPGMVRGSGPVFGGLLEDGGFCYPNVQPFCNLDVMDCRQPQWPPRLVGRDPLNNCQFYPCYMDRPPPPFQPPAPSSTLSPHPTPEGTPSPVSAVPVCHCNHRLTHEQFPTTDFGKSDRWYCARLTKDPEERVCEPMEAVSSSNMPTGSCSEGWIECPGPLAIPAVGPKSVGERCSCTTFENGATEFDTLLCVGEKVFEDSKWKVPCYLPDSKGSCGSAKTCRAPRVLRATLGTSIPRLQSGTILDWHWAVSSAFAKALGVDIQKVKLVSVCPATVCTPSCPSILHERSDIGCLVGNDFDYEKATDLGESNLVVDVQVDEMNEVERATRIAELFSSYYGGPSDEAKQALGSINVTDLTLSASPILQTHRPPPAAVLPVRVILAAAAVCLLFTVLAYAIVSRRKKTQRIATPVLHERELREIPGSQAYPLMVPLMSQPMPLECVDGIPTAQVVGSIRCSDPQSEVENIYAAMFRARHEDRCRSVELWRREMVTAVPDDRDPNIPLGESAPTISDESNIWAKRCLACSSEVTSTERVHCEKSRTVDRWRRELVAPVLDDRDPDVPLGESAPGQEATSFSDESVVWTTRCRACSSEVEMDI